MVRTSGSYSGYDYEYEQCNNSDKWVLKQTYRYDNRDVKTYIFASEEEVIEKINEIESMFDHRSMWD